MYTSKEFKDNFREDEIWPLTFILSFSYLVIMKKLCLVGKTECTIILLKNMFSVLLPNPTDSGVEAESWIIVVKNVRIMNLCFKNLGIMNLCTSARESWITRLWEKLNKMHVSINCVRSRECRIWRFRESNFQTFFRGNIRSWQSACFSSNSGAQVNVQFHTWTKRMMIPSLDGDRSLNTKETKNETTFPLTKSLSQKSSWIMNLEEKFCRNHESWIEAKTTGIMNIKIKMIPLLPPTLIIIGVTIRQTALQPTR